MKSLLQLLAGITLLSTTSHAAGPLVIADFEGSTYGAWKVTGKAFGPGPAQGALPGQMSVEGYAGKGLVNSFFGGDQSTGRLESPVFRIERKFITFLIGGGGWGGLTCLDLVVDGKTVRSATGPNTAPGGSEALAPAAWDVSEFAGRDAQLVIVDEAKEGWGHLNVDQLVQTDDRGAVPLAAKPEPAPQERTRRVTISADFLQLPLMHHADGRRPGLEKLRIETTDGQLLRYMHVDLPEAGQSGDFHYSADLREFKGREVILRYKSRDAAVLDRLEFSATEERGDALTYGSLHRPRVHFSPRVGWMNDINGSYYHDGLYHIFYQFNPASTGRGAGFDMHWGHSVSRDLVNWEEWPVGLFPDAAGQCYSGTAVMQRTPVPGLNEGVKLPAPVLFFTATEPFSQHIAGSRDGGKSWQRYAGNPVIKNLADGDRDPKVIWHEASGQYVMVLYTGAPDKYRFFRSANLVDWEQTSEIAGWFECPEFYPVKSPVTGEDLMLLYGCYRSPEGVEPKFQSNSCYQLGKFDGKTFVPVTEHRHAHLGPNYYAALTFVNAPGADPIMMGWARDTRFPGEAFNQCASVPLTMKLKAIAGKEALSFEPVPQLETLREEPVIALTNATPEDASARLRTLVKENTLDVVLRFRPAATDSVVKVTIRGVTFQFEAATGLLRRGSRQETRLHPDGSVSARFIIDRGIVESFWNQGEAAFANASLHTDDGPAFAVEAAAGTVIEELSVYPMKNARFQ